jgi:hypothetical protein
MTELPEGSGRMSKSKTGKVRRRNRSRGDSPAPSEPHPIVGTFRAVWGNRKERRIFLLLTIPVLLAQYFFWSWMGWTAIIMVP